MVKLLYLFDVYGQDSQGQAKIQGSAEQVEQGPAEQVGSHVAHSSLRITTLPSGLRYPFLPMNSWTLFFLDQ